MDIFSMVALVALMVIAIGDRIICIFLQIKERRDSDVYLDGSRSRTSDSGSKQPDAGK